MPFLTWQEDILKDKDIKDMKLYKVVKSMQLCNSWLNMEIVWALKESKTDTQLKENIKRRLDEGKEELTEIEKLVG